MRPETIRRRQIRDSARGPAMQAVHVLRVQRHATKGLDPMETGLAARAIAFLANPFFLGTEVTSA